MAFKDKFEASYKQMLFTRQDENECLYYFSSTDFENLNTREITIKSSKGHNLKGYFYYYEGFKENTLVIFEHGMGPGHKAYMKEVEMLAKHGYLVFTYDHTGCASSEGSGIGGFAQSLCDSNDVLNYLKSIDELKEYKLFIVGHSMGGYSTLNVLNFHKDIEKIVAISTMISVSHMHNQIFAGLLKPLKKYAYEIEKENNPEYINVDVIDTLKNYQGKALIMHSKDDKLAKYKYHFKKLLANLNNKDNFILLTYNGKNHNPNYTFEALRYKDEVFKKLKKLAKQNKLSSKEEKEEFKNSIDWDKVTHQDTHVWKVIFNFLDK